MVVELIDITTSLFFMLLFIYDDNDICDCENVFRSKLTMSIVTDSNSRDWKL